MTRNSGIHPEMTSLFTQREGASSDPCFLLASLEALSRLTLDMGLSEKERTPSIQKQTENARQLGRLMKGGSTKLFPSRALKRNLPKRVLLAGSQ